MRKKSENIHPVFNNTVRRKQKEQYLKQHSIVIWLTGLSSSGKSTIGLGLEKELNKRGFITQVLDGDNVRESINKNLGFSEEDRKENIRRIAEVSKLFLDCGIITICCFISPTHEIRNIARSIIGKDDFIEVFINAPIEVCEQRDVKGLYEKALKGEIKNFTGISAPYELPENFDMELKTDELSIEESVNKAVKHISPLIEYK